MKHGSMTVISLSQFQNDWIMSSLLRTRIGLKACVLFLECIWASRRRLQHTPRYVIFTWFAFIVVCCHYNDVIMSAMAFQVISVSIVYSTVCSGADQRKDQSSASLAFVRGIHRWPVNSPHKWPVKRKMFQFDDVIMVVLYRLILLIYSREVFQNTWRALQMSFRGNLFSQMESAPWFYGTLRDRN